MDGWFSGWFSILGSAVPQSYQPMHKQTPKCQYCALASGENDEGDSACRTTSSKGMGQRETGQIAPPERRVRCLPARSAPSVCWKPLTGPRGAQRRASPHTPPYSLPCCFVLLRRSQNQRCTRLAKQRPSTACAAALAGASLGLRCSGSSSGHLGRRVVGRVP
jgi:hypothetical protein